MDQTEIVSTVALIVSVLTGILIKINHKKCRSKCGERSIVASLDIENTTPQVVVDTVPTSKPNDP